MLTLVHRIGWLVCVVYSTIPWFWLAIHPHVAYWRSRPRSPYRLLLPLWLGMWIGLGTLTLPWRNTFVYQTRWTWLPAVFLFAAGVWIYKRAGAGFSPAQLGGLPEVMSGHQEQRLAISGIRSRVRHPVYLGHLCEMLAWSLGTGLTVCYGLTAFAMVSGSVMIRLEDRELEQRFGDPYRRYKRTTPAILPRVF